MLEENSQFLFFKKHASTIVIFLLFLVGGAFFIEKKWHAQKLDEKHDCYRAGTLFTELQMGHTLPIESLDEINEIVTRRPYLLPKYEQLIGLSLLAQRQEEKALDHMAAILHRHEQQPKSVQAFNELTLLIEKKEYAEALVLAKELNSTLEHDKNYPTLYACNLLRTLFLAQEANDILLTRVTWDKLATHPLWPQFDSLFQEGSLTLDNYFAINQSYNSCNY